MLTSKYKILKIIFQNDLYLVIITSFFNNQETYKKLELPSTTTHSPAKRPDSKQQETQHTVRPKGHTQNKHEPPKRLTALATPSSSRPTEILAVNYHIHFFINL